MTFLSENREVPSESIVRRLKLVLRNKADLLEMANCRIRDLETELEAERFGKILMQKELDKRARNRTA